MSDTEPAPTSGYSYPDTFAGRLRALVDAWRNRVPDNGIIAEGPDYGAPYLLWFDLDAALAENVQLERALDNLRFELNARIAAESADAAAGSYAGRAEEAEAKLVVAENMRAWLGTEATKLLAEREAAMAYAREVEAGRDAETERAEQAEAALAEMRERLGNLKPAGMQYRANGPHVHGVTEGNVRDYFLNQWVEGYWPEGRQLYAGSWQRIEELCDADANPRTALKCAADEQGDGEGGGHMECAGP